MKIQIELEVDSARYAEVMHFLFSHFDMRPAGFPVVADPTSPTLELPTPAPTGPVTVQKLREIMDEAAREKGIAHVTQALSKVGSRRLQDVPEEKYGALLEALAA